MKTLLKVICVVLFFVTINGCKKSNVPPLKSEDNRLSDLTYLKKLGYDTTGTIELATYYLIEGDILIPKHSLSVTSRQVIQSQSNLIDIAKQQNITIRIDASMPNNGGDLDWITEVSQAIGEYNDLQNSNIRLSLVTGSSADITVRLSNISPTSGLNLPSDVIAAAGLPLNGNPFPNVVVNSAYVQPSTVLSGQKKYNLVHEIGHCLGFRHTNWYGMGESNTLGVGSSPNSGVNPDASSVMNGGTALNSWNGFSFWDIYAISYLYALPKVSIMVNNTSTSGLIRGGINFNNTYGYVASGNLGLAQSNNQVMISPGYYSLTANLAPGEAPIYVSVGGSSPVLVSNYGGTNLGSYYVSTGFYVNGYR
ncbi:hypothetical protein G7074_04405 [Pedobacter sp. HDW13]|uniref:M57 family metalloprotease n=1 Tax=unclassified Pedobacter TaxID=2628915 RepID=UPI000F592EED|nr:MULTISPECIES: M57 family metalloprotease [unclassified Pedobacter]QIL38588.1 hypothetical protein G7074_04405 [Pedobacter sp. HDW13]RQO78763.1 hypothetical protein DBR40_05755 [Pedobacter sp. KBW01]